MATKVTIVCQLFYPELVSTGQTLTELGEELVDLGVEVNVVCGPPSVVEAFQVPRDLDYRGIHIHRTWGTQFPKLKTLGKLCNLVSFATSATLHLLFQRDRSPLIILTNPPFLALAGVLCRWLRRRPYIFLVFDVYPEVALELGVLRRGGLIHRGWNWLNRLLYRNASRVIVLGDRMAERIRRPEKLGPNSDDRLHVVHIWSDDRIIRPVPRESTRLAAEWGLLDKFVVQYSGNMGRIHDVETILETAHRLSDRDDIHFQFIGEGYKKRLVEQFIREKGLINCSVRTYVPREQLPDSMASASVGIVSLLPGCTGVAVPSKAFGVLAAGRPVIALMDPRSEVAELVAEHDCGIVVEPGDAEGLTAAIRRLADDAGLCRVMGERARRSIDERYSLHAAAVAYRGVIDELQ